METFEWWWTHKATLASILLFLSSLLTMYLPVVAQRRLPMLTLRELTALCPNLRWLRWGRFVCPLGTLLLMGLGLLCLRRMPRMEEERGIFVLAAIFCIPSLSTGILALCTGVYREIVGRGEYRGGYYLVAQTGMSWVPWAQIIAGLTIAGLSLAALAASDPR
jgi:hypothetical protein